MILRRSRNSAACLFSAAIVAATAAAAAVGVGDHGNDHSHGGAPEATPAPALTFYPARPHVQTSRVLFGLDYVGSSLGGIVTLQTKAPVVGVGRRTPPTTSERPPAVSTPARPDASGSKNSRPNQPPAPPEPDRAARPKMIDYGAALAVAPIEMQLAGAVVVGGKVLRIGEAFSMQLPLSFFTGTTKRVTQAKAGSAGTSRVVESADDQIVVNCVFVVQALSPGIVTVRVIPDDHFPAREQVLSVRLDDAIAKTNP